MVHRPSRRPGSSTRRILASRAGTSAAGPRLEALETRRVLAADLIVSFTNQGSLVAPGEDITFAIQIENIGDTPAGATTGSLVLSRNETIGDSDDEPLASLPTDPLNPGNTAGGGASVTIPADLPQGLWFLGVIVDALDEVAEDDETNNTDISDTTIVRNAPDVEALLTLSAPTPLPVPGDTIEVTFAFANVSDFAAGPHTSRVVLSSDSTFGNDDDRALFEHEFASIASFGSPGFVEDLVIPADLEPGNWRLGVLADVNEDLVELSEANNQALTAFDLVVVAEFRPDLAPDVDFGAINTPTIPGSNLPVEFGVSNTTDFLAAASTARVVLTLDDVLGNGDDVLLASVDINALGASATQIVRPVVTIPANLATGEWFLGIIADAGESIGEQDEDNNGLLSPDPAVTVFAPSDVNIVIFGGGLGSQTILHETKAQRSKGTGFGPVEVEDETKSATFVIFNGGNDQLFISSIEVRGQRPGDFAITVLPEFTVAAGSTQSFTVTFDPTDFGTRRANIAIFSSDPDRPRFTMRIAGRGIPDPTLQDIAVTGGTDTISDGDRKARNTTGQKFGTAAVGQPIDRIFTITNEGDAILSFLSPVIRVAGTNPDDFSVLAFPSASTLAPGATTTFTIRFTPQAVGLRKATIEVISDDPDEGTFDFRVSALGL